MAELHNESAPSEALSDFLSNIRNSLVKNGFPNRAIALPVSSLEHAAKTRGLDLSDVLANFKAEGIDAIRETDRIVFKSMISSTTAQSLAQKAAAFADIFRDIDPAELAALQGMNKFKMFFKLRELAKKLKPEQLAKMQEFYTSLTPDERSELEQAAKRMQ